MINTINKAIVNQLIIRISIIHLRFLSKNQHKKFNNQIITYLETVPNYLTIRINL